MSTTKYGPLVRLWGIHSSQLPPTGASASILEPFLTSLLDEAFPFIDSVPASNSDNSGPWKPKEIKTFPHSIAPVHLFERIVSANDLEAVVKEHGGHIEHLNKQATKKKPEAEAWALRKSVHEDKAAEGTAAWGEWVRCFKEDHAGAEEKFTPTVLGTRRIQEWDCSGVEIQTSDGTVWADWTLRLESSTHKLPAPLKNRVFPVLQATASARGRRDFLVVQVAARDIAAAAGEAELVRGAYTSVERIRDAGDGIEWLMGTASDAKGVVPGWVQKVAVPGQIAKDVDLFLSWIAKERSKTGG